jgi:hypothetical protein
MSAQVDSDREVDACNALVTEAIGRAERTERESPLRARDAWRDVALWEQRLAALLPADDEEGRVARRGAVTARIKAGDRAGAEALLARYAGDVGAHGEDVAYMRAALDADDARLAVTLPYLARRGLIGAMRSYAARRARGGFAFSTPR